VMTAPANIAPETRARLGLLLGAAEG